MCFSASLLGFTDKNELNENSVEKGLMEFINKKNCREITTGLNLPSSITSTAFTMRTRLHGMLQLQCQIYHFDWDEMPHSKAAHAALQVAQHHPVIKHERSADPEYEREQQKKQRTSNDMVIGKKTE